MYAKTRREERAVSVCVRGREWCAAVNSLVML